MEVNIHSVINDNCSCNFCDRGEINLEGMGLIYPYDAVCSFKREGSGLLVFICPDCLEELRNKVENIRFVSSPVIEEIKNLLNDGKRLGAVKYYHNCTGNGLKDSKDFVEKLMKENPTWYKPDWN